MPVGAPRDLHVRITTPTSAHATWTGVPNTRESIRGKLLGYKVLAQLCGNCRSTCALAMGLRSEISQNCNIEVHCSNPTYQDTNHCRWFTIYSAAESNTSVTSVNMAMWVFSYPFLFHLLYFVYIVSLIFISLFKDLMNNFH